MNLTVNLPQSNLTVSRVAFGLSRLHHIFSRSDRLRLLDGARDLGVTHFDTAPLYGDGLGEGELGRSMGGVRDRITITTKFGFLETKWLGRMGSLAQPVWAARGMLRRVGLVPWYRRSFCAATMEASLNRSLRRLRTDWVDIFMLHEPRVEDLQQNAKLLDSLSEAKRAGKVRHLGIAGGECEGIAALYPGLFDVWQMEETTWASGNLVPDLTFGVFASVTSSASGTVDAGSLLAAALRRRPSGAVIIGTRNLNRVREALEIARDVS